MPSKSLGQINHEAYLAALDLDLPSLRACWESAASAVLAAQPEPVASWELVEKCEKALTACMAEMKQEFEHAGLEYEDEENQCDSDECLRCFFWNTCEPVIAEIAAAKGAA